MSRPWLHQDDVDWRRTLILEIMYEGTLHYATSPLCHYAAVQLCGNATMPICCCATMRQCHFATTPLWNYATMPASIQLRSGHCPGQARLHLWRRWPRSRTLYRWSFSSFVSFVASSSDRWVCPTQATRSSVTRRQSLSRSFSLLWSQERERVGERKKERERESIWESKCMWERGR